MSYLRFSQRKGITPIREFVQLESIDLPLKNRLWNCIYSDFFGSLNISNYNFKMESQRGNACRKIWTDYLILAIDKIPVYNWATNIVDFELFINSLRNKYFSFYNWAEIYDLVEYLAYLNLEEYQDIEFIESINLALEKENAGYRLIEGRIAEISSKEEVIEVNKAISNSNKWSSVQSHLLTALDYLSDRESKDFRNSIKESISAVESMCKIIAEDKDATLNKALSKIEKTYKLHGALRQAFGLIYGYTSDSGGIRHALQEKDNPIPLAEARFMLISCSAFINYLISLSN